MRVMSEAQKKLRAWFRRKKWKTCNTPTDQGFYLLSPTRNDAGMLSKALDPETGQVREYSMEHRMGMELDRFTCDYVTFEIEERKHWWKRDESIPESPSNRGYSWVPSDDFSKWERRGWMTIPVEDILKLAELVKVAQQEWLDSRPSKNHLNYMESIAKSCPFNLMGRNVTYDELKRRFSNERLREEGKL